MKYAFIFVFLSFYLIGHAQPYTNGQKTRHSFAQMTLGLNNRYLPEWKTSTLVLSENGDQLLRTTLNPSYESQFIIGGTHFWGHADFYVAIPMVSISKGQYNSGVETGCHLYPWPIQSKSFRPFLGTSINVSSYRFMEASIFQKTLYPLHVGLTYLKKQWLFTLSASLNHQRQFSYNFNQSLVSEVSSAPFWLNMSFKYMLETTLSAEKSWKNGKAQAAAERLGALGLLNSYSVSLGISSTWFMATSNHNKVAHPEIHEKRAQSPFPEFGLGYYWHKPDLHINYAFRSIQSNNNGLGLEQTISRVSHGIEVFKFLADYHGFVPFAGPIVSYEQLQIDESGSSRYRGSHSGLGYGLVFGWDIRPNRLQNWILRTNLRYFPKLDVLMNSGNSFSLDQIEFNFIQLVVYPQRFKKWKKFRKTLELQNPE